MPDPSRRDTTTGDPTFIRSLHPYAYRSGEWAQIVGRDSSDGRACYLVVFPDGATDRWVVHDPDGDYEFRDA